MLQHLPSRVRDAIAQPNARRAHALAHGLTHWLSSGERVLDIGAGHGFVAQAIAKRGCVVTALDVRNTSFVPDLPVQIYDGRTIPFGADAFDAALLITVLHHIPDPDATLREAARVASKIIILEDLVESPAERAFTHFADSWLNWEWRGHPHSNRSDADWRATFAGLNLRVAHASQTIHTFFPFRFRHGLYVLESRP